MANDAFIKMADSINKDYRFNEAHAEAYKQAASSDMPKAAVAEETSLPPARIKRRRPWKLYGYGLVVLAILFGGIYGYCNYVYGEGTYSGYVRMFHKVGAIKTWEGELDKRKLGGSYHKEDIFEFSVQNDSVALEVQRAEKSGEWVTVNYKEYLVSLPWRGKTTVIVHGVSHTEGTPPIQKTGAMLGGE